MSVVLLTAFLECLFLMETTLLMSMKDSKKLLNMSVLVKVLS